MNEEEVKINNLKIFKFQINKFIVANNPYNGLFCTNTNPKIYFRKDSSASVEQLCKNQLDEFWCLDCNYPFLTKLKNENKNNVLVYVLHCKIIDHYPYKSIVTTVINNKNNLCSCIKSISYENYTEFTKEKNIDKIVEFLDKNIFKLERK